MTERRVNLDVGTMPTGTGASDAHGQPRREADPQLADQFRSSLAGNPAPEAQGAPAAPSPFSLFGAAPSADASAGTPSPSTERRAQVIEETVSRMLVSDAARGPAEVRIRLKDDLLAGTELRLAQREGRLEAEFVATDAESAEWLAGQSAAIARELAQRLRRDVRVCVRRGDGDEEGPLADEAATGEAERPAGPGSLFGHRIVEQDGGNDR